MTRTEEQLAELLHRATAEVDGVPFEDVARRARRHRRIAASASAIAVAALTAGPATAGAALAGHVQDRPAASGNHHVASLTRHRRIAFEGVLCTLPSGWKTTTQPSCGWPASNTLVINYRTGPVLYCPAPFQPASLPTSVTLTTIYGPQYADGWAGQRTTWHGQPAWQPQQCTPEVAEVRPPQPSAERAHEDQAVVAGLGETLEMPAQLVRDLARDCDRPAASARFRLLLDQLAVVHLCGRSDYAYHAVIQVQVRPAQCSQLTESEVGECGQEQHGAVSGGDADQQPDEVRQRNDRPLR